MSNKSEKPSVAGSPIADPPEPNPFTPSEFAAWRGMLRVYSTVVRELDRRLQRDHRIGLDSYGVLITLITEPGSQLTIGQLGESRLLSPSGISRAVDKLAKEQLVARTANPADGRSLLVGLTPYGVQRLREAQVTHHSTVRELLFGNLDEHDIKTLGDLWEKAIPGSVSSPIWPL
jgi:DNA-binding MarR family transcriptional regulator